MENGGWTVLLRRQDGSENFTREWVWYADGFGGRTGNYTCFKNAKQIKLTEPYNQNYICLKLKKGKQSVIEIFKTVNIR